MAVLEFIPVIRAVQWLGTNKPEVEELLMNNMSVKIVTDQEMVLVDDRGSRGKIETLSTPVGGWIVSFLDEVWILDEEQFKYFKKSVAMPVMHGNSIPIDLPTPPHVSKKEGQEKELDTTLCPEHKIQFQLMARSLGGRKICPVGCIYRFIEGKWEKDS